MGQIVTAKPGGRWLPRSEGAPRKDRLKAGVWLCKQAAAGHCKRTDRTRRNLNHELETSTPIGSSRGRRDTRDRRLRRRLLVELLRGGAGIDDHVGISVLDGVIHDPCVKVDDVTG